MENISSKIYFNPRRKYDTKNNILLGVPIVKKNILLYLDERKLNLFQEIVLKMCNCGKSSNKELKEVFIKLEDELLEHIKKELRNLGYLDTEYKITPEGEQAIKDTTQKLEIKQGYIYFNRYTGKYIPVIQFEDSLESTNLKGKKRGFSSVNLGSIGNPNSKKINIIEERVENKKIDDNEFFEIIKREIGNLKAYKHSLNLSSKEKLENLEDICKFDIIGEEEAYLLYTLSRKKDLKGEVLLSNPFHEWSIEEELKDALIENKVVQGYLHQEIQLEYEVSREEKNNYQKNQSIKKRELIELSEGKLKGNKSLLNSLEKVDSQKEFKKLENLSGIVDAIYKLLLESFSFYANLNPCFNPGKTSSIELDEILLKKFGLKENSEEYRKFKIIDMKKIKRGLTKNKVLVEILSYCLLMEEKLKKERKIYNLSKKYPDFFTKILSTIALRNMTDHYSEELKDVPLDKYMELQDFSLSVVEDIVQFKLVSRLERQNKIQRIGYSNIKEKSEKLITEGFFKGMVTEEYESELIDIQTSFELYKDFNDELSKSQIFKKIGILFEKNLKSLGNYVVKENISLLPGDEAISLKEIEKEFFIEKIPERFWDKEFLKVLGKNITLHKQKIENLFRRFDKGTLNNYTTVLLYSTKNKSDFLNKILKEIPEFFKVPFIISDYRGHNGETDLTLDDLENLIQEIYNIQKRFMREKERFGI